MWRRWRFQFGLRTLLVAALILPPLIALQYRRWRDDHIWSALQAAKQRRDQSLMAWRATYDAFSSGSASAAQEEGAQQQYYAARQDVESAAKVLYERYGNSEKALVRAMQERHLRK